MSNREQVLQMVNAMPEYKIDSLLGFLRAFLYDSDDTPNAETVAAMQEINEMIRTGEGQHFQGGTAEFFAMLDAEDEGDA